MTTKGRSTKIKIIKAATEYIYLEGLYNVTYGQIAQKVGLTQPAIYRHFKDMNDIILQACEYWVEQARTVIAVDEEFRSAKEGLRSYVEGNLRYTLKHRSQDALLLGLYYQSLNSPVLMKAYKEMNHSALQRLKILILRGQNEKQWKVKDPDAKAKTLHSYIVGEVIKLIIEPQDEKIEERVKRVTEGMFSLLQC